MADARPITKSTPHDDKILRLGFNWEKNESANDESGEVKFQKAPRSRSNEGSTRSRSRSRPRTRSENSRHSNSRDSSPADLREISDRNTMALAELASAPGPQRVYEMNAIMSAQIDVLEERLAEAEKERITVIEDYEDQVENLKNEVTTCKHQVNLVKEEVEEDRMRMARKIKKAKDSGSLEVKEEKDRLEKEFLDKFCYVERDRKALREQVEKLESEVSKKENDRETLRGRVTALQLEISHRDKQWKEELEQQESRNQMIQENLRKTIKYEQARSKIAEDTKPPTLVKGEPVDVHQVIDCMSEMMKTMQQMNVCNEDRTRQIHNELINMQKHSDKKMDSLMEFQREETARIEKKFQEFETRLGSPIRHLSRADYRSPIRSEHEPLHSTPYARDDPRHYEEALAAAAALTSDKPAPHRIDSSRHVEPPHTFPGTPHPSVDARYHYHAPPPTPATSHAFEEAWEEYEEYEARRPRHRSRERRHGRSRRHHYDKEQSVKIYDGLPRKFDGERNKDPVAHLDSYEDYCKVQRMTTGDEKLDRFGLTLEGSARRWFSSIKPKTWQELTLQFTRQYTGTKTYSIANERFKNLKWNEGQESLETYRQNLTTLAQGVNRYLEVDDVTGMRTGEISKEFKSQFIMGLPHDYRMAMTDLNEDDDFGVLMRRAEKFEGLKCEEGKNKPSAMKVQIQPATTPDSSGGETENMAHLFKHALNAISQVHESYRKPYSTGRNSRSSSNDSRYRKDHYTRERSRSRQRYSRQPYRSKDHRSSSRDRRDHRSNSRNRHNYRSTSRNRYRSDSRGRNGYRSRRDYRSNSRSRNDNYTRYHDKYKRSRSNSRSSRSPSRSRSSSSSSQYSGSSDSSRRTRASTPFGKSGACFGCGQEGHWKNECPLSSDSEKSHFQ